MTKTPTPASHAVNTAPISADLRGMDQPQIGSHAVNEAAWAFVNQMPHQLPGPVFNDLKPAVHAAISEYLRQTANAAPTSPVQQDAPAAQPSRECLQQSDLHAAIMNLPCEATASHFLTKGERQAYRQGHQEARHAAAELAAALQAAPPAQAGEAIAEIVSASHDDAQFGERGVNFLSDFQHLEYGTKLYALAAPPAPAGVAVPECLTCSDHGAVGNILTAEPCPDCTTATAGVAVPVAFALQWPEDRALNRLCLAVVFDNLKDAQEHAESCTDVTILPLYAAAPAQAVAVPKGWKLAPINDTPAMWTAGGRAIKSCGGHERDAASLTYKAMIEAAPAAPAQEHATQLAGQGQETTPDGVPSNVELRGLWYGAGGSFHGPCVETGTMPEAKLLPFLRSLVAPSSGSEQP